MAQCVADPPTLAFRAVGSAALIGTLLGVGCGRDATNDAANDVQAAASVILRGGLVWGHEVHSFTPCGSNEEVWVLDGTDGELRRISEELASQPYERLFVEVRATEGPAPDTGFGADYAGAVRVTEVRRAEYEGHGCGENLADIEFRAFGVEPFWNLTIDRFGLTLRRPDPSAMTAWPRVGAQLSGAAVEYRSETEEAGRIDVELVEGRCRDAMAGSYFPFTVEVRLPAETLRGCALQGDLAHFPTSNR